MRPWQAFALCRTRPAHLFDSRIDGAGENVSQRNERHDAARAICTACPVAQACLNDALTDDTAEGIRAGYLIERDET